VKSCHAALAKLQIWIHLAYVSYLGCQSLQRLPTGIEVPGGILYPLIDKQHNPDGMQ
jgi:hypothetical protein